MTESYRKPVQVGVPGDIACRADRTPPEDLKDPLKLVACRNS